MTKFSNIIPAPKGYWADGSYKTFETTVCGDFPLEAASFISYAKKILDLDVVLAEDGAIETKKCDCMTAGEYRLEIGEEEGKILIKASDSDGANAAFASLLQLAEKDYEGKLQLPKGTVCDKPECKWRGLLIDCARRNHSVSLLKKYVDLCRFYKIKYLHIHFTDDENFTLPSKAYPAITTPENCYSYEEIAEIDSYAYENGVSIIPELDTPGHSTSMLKAYPDVFGVEGIIKFTKDAIEATKVLYRELCEMFPHSEYIHIGGDESRLGWWLNDECFAYGEEIGISVNDEAPGMTPNEWVMLRFLATFIKEMAETITECGKKPAVWEGFNKETNHIVPKNVTVMVFDSSYQLAPSLCEAGFEVINCAWFPLYVVIPYWIYTKKNCFDWNVYAFGTINENSPYKDGYMQYNYLSSIQGGQLCSWGDGLKCEYKDPEVGLAKELSEICERLPAVAENTWNREKRRSYGDFLESMEEIAGKIEKLLK